MSQNYHVFLSYARKDIVFAEKLYADLVNQGVSVWMDNKEIQAGQQWVKCLENALDRSQSLIFVVSPDSSESKYCAKELIWMTEGNRPIFPILLRDTNIPFIIRGIQYIDFREWYLEEIYQAQLKHLLNSLQQLPIKFLPEAPPIDAYLRNLISKLAGSRGVIEYIELSNTLQTRPEPKKRLAPGQYHLIKKQEGFKHVLLFDLSIEILDTYPQFIIIGEPGSGKTTTLSWLALKEAECYLEDNKPDSRLPIFLSLFSWQNETTIYEFMDDQLKKLGIANTEFIKNMLIQGQVTLYLDGLNEMGSYTSHHIKELQKWLKSSNSPKYIVLSSRASDFHSDDTLHFAMNNSEFPIIQIDNLATDQIEIFAKKYLDTQATDFLREIRNKAGLLDLTNNPYLLSTLILIYEFSSDKSIPPNKGLLMQQLAITLWQRESEIRHEKMQSFGQVKLNFGKLAFTMIQENQPQSVPIQYTLKILGNSSLLKLGVDANFLSIENEMVRFYHQLLQEYFAATYLKTIKSEPNKPNSSKEAFTYFLKFITRIIWLKWHLAPMYLQESLAYLGIVPRETIIRAIAVNPFHYSYAQQWDEVLISLVGIDDNPDEIVREIAVVNPFLAVQCLKHHMMATEQTSQYVVNIIKKYMKQYDYNRYLELLGELGNEQATKVIISFFHASKDNSWQREHAAQALGKTRNNLAIPVLLDALNDEDDEVQWFAALSIAKMPNPPIKEMLNILKNVENENSYGHIHRGLINIGKSAIPYILELLADENLDINLSSRLAHILVNISPSKEAIPGLLKIMEDKNRENRSFRQKAVDILGEMKAVTELNALLYTIDDWTMQMRIIGQLTKIGTSEALDAVAKYKSSR